MTKKRILVIASVFFIIFVVFLMTRKSSNINLQNQPNISASVTKLDPSKSKSIDSLTNSGSKLTIYIDRKTGFLKSLNPDQVLYQKPVLVFSYRYPLVAIIERQDRTAVFLFNIETRSTKTFKIEKESSFISASINKNSSFLYALGSFNTNDHTSQLYSININTGFSDAIARVPDSEVNAINEKDIVLFDSGENENSSNLQYYNAVDRKVIYSRNLINSYNISPDSTKILTKSSGSLNIFNTTNSSSKQFIVNPNDIVNWKDNSTVVVLQNILPGVKIGYLNIDNTNNTVSFRAIEEMKDKSVAQIINVINNQLIVTDNRYNFYFIDLPQNL